MVKATNYISDKANYQSYNKKYVQDIGRRFDSALTASELMLHPSDKDLKITIQHRRKIISELLRAKLLNKKSDNGKRDIASITNRFFAGVKMKESQENFEKAYQKEWTLYKFLSGRAFLLSKILAVGFDKTFDESYGEEKEFVSLYQNADDITLSSALEICTNERVESLKVLRQFQNIEKNSVT